MPNTPMEKIYVAGCQSIKSDQTNFGTRPKSGKNKLSDFAIDCKRKIKKFIETNVLIAEVKSAGLYENSLGLIEIGISLIYLILINNNSI